MAVPREHLELFLEDLAQAATCFRFDTDVWMSILWTHSPTQWRPRLALLFAAKPGSDTRFLQFELKRPERTHAIVIHAGTEEYSIFQGATLRTLPAYVVGQLLLDQDPRIQLFRFELRRGMEFLEDIIAKAKESVQASD